MLNSRLRKRLKKGRPVTSITMRIPVDVVESLKAIAPTRGLSGYQTLLKSYISEGLRRDEAELDQYTARKLAEALKRRGGRGGRTAGCSGGSRARGLKAPRASEWRMRCSSWWYSLPSTPHRAG